MKINRLVLFLSIGMISFLTSCEKKQECPNNFTPPAGTFTYSDEGRTNEMLNYPQIIAMLTEYDKTRTIYLEKALGYEDTRMVNFDFDQFKKYLGHIENLSDSAKVKITGISFVSAADAHYGSANKSYQSLIYVPTTTINRKQVAFDPVQSVEQGRLVTLNEMLTKYGYKWPSDKVSNSKKEMLKMQNEKSIDTIGERSGLGNKGTLSPPM